MDSKILSLHDVFTVCQKAGVFRLVKNEEDDKYIRIIICGTYRIQKNKKTGVVSMWGYKLKDKDCGVWCRRSTLPGNVHLFWSRRAGFDLRDWLFHAVEYIIKSLIGAGYSIGDKLHLYKIRENDGKDAFISTLLPNEFERSFYSGDFFEPMGKMTFNYPDNVQHIHISKHELREEIEKKIYNRIYKVIGIDNIFNASKSLSKSIWGMIDKAVFTNYARASHCSIMYKSVRQAMFEDYLDFSKRICIADGADFGGLWPMVGRLIKQNKTGQFALSGKSKELFEKLRFPRGISYADFRHLRHTRLSLVSAVSQNNDESFRVISRLLRHPLVKKYPVKVIYWIIDYLEGRIYCERYCERENDIYRVCVGWLEYHRDLFKNIGFCKHKTEPWETSRWEMEKNHLCHAIDWVLNAEPIINKNQKWPSFWRLSQDWTQHLEEGTSAIIKKWKGTGINWVTVDSSVNELVAIDDLRNEGRDMEHCVASYAHECASGAYIAISLSTETERATLGLSRTAHDLTYRLDQMRGIRNQPVSRNMLNKGRRIVNLINEHVKNL